MIRLLTTLISVFAVAIVTTQVAACAWYWSQGTFTRDTVDEIITLVTGASESDAAVEVDIPEELAQIAKEEVLEKRAMSILELTSRKRELDLMKSLIDRKAIQITDAKQELSQMKTEFEKELKMVEDSLGDKAAKQARGILLAMQPAQAVEKLMTLTPEEAVHLMKGISEKPHAKILQEFQGVAEKTDRGNEIFQAIVRGMPQQGVIDRNRDAVDEDQ